MWWALCERTCADPSPVDGGLAVIRVMLRMDMGDLHVDLQV